MLLEQCVVVGRVGIVAQRIVGNRRVAAFRRFQLVHKNAFLRCYYRSRFQYFIADIHLRVPAVVFKISVWILKIALRVGFVDELNVLGNVVEPVLVAHHKHKRVAAHARIAFPAVVGVAVVPSPVDNPLRIGKHLVFNGCVFLGGLVRHVCVPGRILADSDHNLVNILVVVRVFRDVAAEVFALVARVAHNAERVANSAALRDSFETDGGVGPTAVKVLIIKPIAVIELVTFVLVVNLVVLAFGAFETEDEPAVAGLPVRWQADALRVGVRQVHIEQNGVGRAKVCYGVERRQRLFLTGNHNCAQCG